MKGVKRGVSRCPMSLAVSTGASGWSAQPGLGVESRGRVILASVFASVLQAISKNNRTTGGKARTSYLVMLAMRSLKGCEEVNVPSWVCKNARNGAPMPPKESGARQACDRTFRSDLSTRSSVGHSLLAATLWKANKSSNGKSPPMPKRCG
jgi:hypothetical protein